jgi:hypothetical protein
MGLKPFRDARFVEECLVRLPVARPEVVILVGTRVVRRICQSSEVFYAINPVLGQNRLVVPR